MRNFRVCHIIGNIGMGGTQRHLYYLIKNRSPRFANSRLLCMPMYHEKRDTYYENLFCEAGVKPEYINPIRVFRYGEIVFDLYRFIRKFRPHIVHNWMFDFNTVGSVAAALAGVPVIISTVEITTDNIEQVWWPPVNKPNRRFLSAVKLAARLSDKTICNSEFLSSQYEEWAGIKGNDRVITILNGIDTESFTKVENRDEERAALGISPDEPVVGIMGRIAPEKDYETFFDMAAIVAHGAPKAKFLVVGCLKDNEDADPSAFFEDRLRKIGIFERTVFTGKTYRAREMLSCMDVAVSSSIQEGCSNYLIEAQVVGLPAVATDVSGSSEVIVDGSTGFIVPPRNPQALAEKVLDIVRNPEKAACMGSEGERIARDRFAMQNMVSATEGLYIDLLASKGI